MRDVVKSFSFYLQFVFYLFNAMLILINLMLFCTARLKSVLQSFEFLLFYFSPY